MNPPFLCLEGWIYFSIFVACYKLNKIMASEKKQNTRMIISEQVSGYRRTRAFMNGVSSLADIAGGPCADRRLRRLCDDRQAIASDWAQVGRDIASAALSYKSNHRP